MDKNAIIRFLEAIDAELAPFASSGERLELHLLGRSALIVRYGMDVSTKDVDVVWHGETSTLYAKAFELFGQGTPNAVKWGLFLERVPAGYPPVPGRYKRLAIDLPGNWLVLQPKQLNPHDLAITKLKRFHAGDREDLKILCDAGELNREELERALDSAFPYGDREPDYERAEPNFRKLIEYLEGRRDDL